MKPPELALLAVLDGPKPRSFCKLWKEAKAEKERERGGGREEKEGEGEGENERTHSHSILNPPL